MKSYQSRVSDSSSVTLQGEGTFRHRRVDRWHEGGGRDWREAASYKPGDAWGHQKREERRILP